MGEYKKKKQIRSDKQLISSDFCRFEIPQLVDVYAMATSVAKRLDSVKGDVVDSQGYWEQYGSLNEIIHLLNADA